MEGAPHVSSEFLEVPYDDRWDLLRELITWLYMEYTENDKLLKLKAIVKIMELKYKFYASEGQYKRHFSIWKLKRALPSTKKDQIVQAVGSRAKQGKSSVVTHKGKDITQKVRRHTKEQNRREYALCPGISCNSVGMDQLSGHALQCGNRVFMNWSVPAAVLFPRKTKRVDYPSPYYSANSPMSDIQVATPCSNMASSSRNAASPAGAGSPHNERAALTIAVKESVRLTRAHLFAQKHHSELLRGMTSQEKIITTDWLHQFWQYSFTAARTWGRGPRMWDASSLGFERFISRTLETNPGSPMASEHPSPHHRKEANSPNALCLPEPSPLCCWSIHVMDDVVYDSVESPEPEVYEEDIDNENSWRPWKEAGSINDFASQLNDNLESNEFSTFDAGDLPISAMQIVRSAKRSPEQVLQDAFGFSIMARNLNLVENMMVQIQIKMNSQFVFNDMYPLHLAASYMNGAKSCCDVFAAIAIGLPSSNSHGSESVRKLYVNNLNHTVLDNLMISILKAHTSCAPAMVDPAFKKEQRFAGEEVDICGRWDADSECIRRLQANGNARIPQTWKHMFCHTSTQAITHCIGSLFEGPFARPDINHPSGLFLRRCLNETCGLKLQLGPLHTLVVVAVYLAQEGSEEENLFGIIACLLCMLSLGADPTLKADVSMDALLGRYDSQVCSHSELDPLQLAYRVPPEWISSWSSAKTVGWKVLCCIIQLSQTEWTRGSSVEDRDVLESESDQSEPDIDQWFPGYCNCNGDESNYFGQSPTLATLWAAAQTEMLTYRRITQNDPWLSSNFNMQSIFESLDSGTELTIPLVSQGMMNEYCVCGRFGGDEPVCKVAQHACTHYFSNMEDWNRTTYLACWA